MTNKKTTKRALMMSVVSLFLCFTMLLGTTYAWFTDSVTSSGNKIMAGTLDIKLFMHTENGAVEITNESDPIFGAAGLAQDDAAATLWEPGKTQVVYLSLVNAGTLDLKYKVNLVVKEDKTNPANLEAGAAKLYEVMEYAITPDAQYGDVTAWDEAAGVSVDYGTNMTQAATVELKRGETHYFALSVHMLEEAGNEYQGLSLNFDVAVFASQLASEEDSFGPDYDDLATYEDGAYILPKTEDATADVAADNSFSYENENKTFKVSGTVEDPADDVSVTVVPTSNTNAMNTVAAMANSTALSYDITVEGQKDGSDVYVEFFLGKNLANVKLYHEGAPITCDYDSMTGMVSFTTTSFSVYTATYSIVDILPLANVEPMAKKDYPTEILDLTDFLLGGSIDLNKTFAEGTTLDVGFSFKALEDEIANIEESPYRYWIADFVVKFDKDVAPGSCGIAGNYGYPGLEDLWIGFQAIDLPDVDDGVNGIPAGTEIRLLGSAGYTVNYEEICKVVKEFKCGAFALDDSVVKEGTTITVELRLYETKDAADTETNTTNEETGNYETIGVYKYTFGE